MASSIENYRNMVEQPWGKMFYDLIFRQLDISNDKRLKILDCGAGFCITSDHYAGEHDVTALEPEEEMRFSAAVKRMIRSEHRTGPASEPGISLMIRLIRNIVPETAYS